MVHIGYKLSSEDTGPKSLVRYAEMVEKAGFSFAMISDHYHPWIDKQNESPFVWGTLGGISQVTNSIMIGTAVTCPTIRIHPAVVAQAAATTADMMDGRFLFGVGSGENLNEHILGGRWPPATVRIDMLEEAVNIIRMLWSGGNQNFNGKYYTVENARLYSLPSKLPPILMAADGEIAAKTAARISDGLITPGVKPDLVEIFKRNGGKNKPCYAEASVCWADDKESGKKTAYKYWPILSNNGLNYEIPNPRFFDKLAAKTDQETLTRNITCGDDPQDHIDEIRRFVDAGYDHVFVHQLGPHQEGFIKFYMEEVLPEFL